jgi:hypothetical protein
MTVRTQQIMWERKWDRALALAGPLLLLTAAPVRTGDEWILGTLRKEFNPKIASINQKIELLQRENQYLRNEILDLNLRVTRLEAFLPKGAPDRPR